MHPPGKGGRGTKTNLKCLNIYEKKVNTGKITNKIKNKGYIIPVKALLFSKRKFCYAYTAKMKWGLQFLVICATIVPQVVDAVCAMHIHVSTRSSFGACRHGKKGTRSLRR
jgi:hypothetical protein